MRKMVISGFYTCWVSFEAVSFSFLFTSSFIFIVFPFLLPCVMTTSFPMHPYFMSEEASKSREAAKSADEAQDSSIIDAPKPSAVPATASSADGAPAAAPAVAAEATS